MWGLFKRDFRAAHELERSELLKMILGEADGSIEGSEFRDYLHVRDQRLGLEFDSSWVNFFIIEHLVETFPEARFVLLVRDCYSWVESVVNHALTREIPADVWEFMDWWFEPHKYPHRDEEQSLKEHGLFSIDCYLNAWNRHTVETTERVPPDRLLVVRTHEISRRLGDIARFLGIPVERLDEAESHLNKGTKASPLASLVDRGFTESRVARACGYF